MKNKLLTTTMVILGVACSIMFVGAQSAFGSEADQRTGHVVTLVDIDMRTTQDPQIFVERIKIGLLGSGNNLVPETSSGAPVDGKTFLICDIKATSKQKTEFGPGIFVDGGGNRHKAFSVWFVNHEGESKQAWTHGDVQQTIKGETAFKWLFIVPQANISKGTLLMFDKEYPVKQLEEKGMIIGTGVQAQAKKQSPEENTDLEVTNPSEMALLNVEIDNERIQLKTASQSESRVEIVGLSASTGDVAKFMKQLDESPYLKDVMLLRIEQSNDPMLGKQFKIAVTVWARSIKISF
jgi:hypothetical protein